MFILEIIRQYLPYVHICKNMLYDKLFHSNACILEHNEYHISYHTLLCSGCHIQYGISCHIRYSIPFCKVIIQKSCREVSPVEQEKIDCEYLAHLEPKKNSKKIQRMFYKKIQCYNIYIKNLFDPENIEKPLPKKFADNRPQFFLQYFQLA